MVLGGLAPLGFLSHLASQLAPLALELRTIRVLLCILEARVFLGAQACLGNHPSQVNPSPLSVQGYQAFQPFLRGQAVPAGLSHPRNQGHLCHRGHLSCPRGQGHLYRLGPLFLQAGLHGLWCLAAPRAPPGQELQGSRAAPAARAVLVGREGLGSLGYPSGPAFLASLGFP